MKLQIGIHFSRTTGEEFPIYKEVTEEEFKEANNRLIENGVRCFYDLVVAELEKQDKKLKEEV